MYIVFESRQDYNQRMDRVHWSYFHDVTPFVDNLLQDRHALQQEFDREDDAADAAMQNGGTDDEGLEEDRHINQTERELHLIEHHLSGFFDRGVTQHWSILTENAKVPSEAMSFCRQYSLMLTFNADMVISDVKDSNDGVLEAQVRVLLQEKLVNVVHYFFRYYTNEIKDLIFKNSFRLFNKRDMPRHIYDEMCFTFLKIAKKRKTSLAVVDKAAYGLSQELLRGIWKFVKD